MKNIALALSFLVSSSLALSLDEIVDVALQNNKDLKRVQTSIDVVKQNIKLSRKWSNPTLTLGINDIHFDEPFKRDAEAMQAQYIGFSQIIPMGNKLKIKEEISKKDKNITVLEFEDKKLELRAKIYEASYNILILEKKLKLLKSYERNIKKIQKLSKDLYTFGKSTQNEVLEAKIAYSNIQIQKQNLKNMIDNLYLKLEQITYKKINTIEESLKAKELTLNIDIQNHPKIKIQKEKINKYKQQSKLELENEKSDIKVNLTYFNRDSKFKDYANISVNIPLSLYKTEKVKSLMQRKKVKEQSSGLQDVKQKFKTEIKLLQNNINSAYKNYLMISETIIPLKQKIQKNLENYNSFSSIKPQVAIQNLNELISYELKSYEQLEEYYSNYSKSIYYTYKAK